VLERQIPGIQPDDCGGGKQLDFNARGAVEGSARRIDGQLDFVAVRDDGIGQAESGSRRQGAECARSQD
jgi:hypothetical protein